MLGKGDGVWHEPDVPEEADARKRLDAWLKALRIMMFLFFLVELLCCVLEQILLTFFLTKSHKCKNASSKSE